MAAKCALKAPNLETQCSAPGKPPKPQSTVLSWIALCVVHTKVDVS